jgi:hypothetical protein
MTRSVKTKRGAEHPKVLLRRTLAGFEPAAPWVAEQLMHYSIGAVIEAQFWQSRSPEHLALYWCVLHGCVENSENKYGRTTDLHDALKIALGYTHKIRMLDVGPGHLILTRLAALIVKILKHDGLPWWAKEFLDQAFKLCMELGEHVGDTIVMPGSIALDKMDQSEFRVYFDRAMGELRKAGYPVDELIKQGKDKLKHTAGPPAQPLLDGAAHGRSQTPTGRDRNHQDQATHAAPGAPDQTAGHHAGDAL